MREISSDITVAGGRSSAKVRIGGAHSAWATTIGTSDNTNTAVRIRTGMALAAMRTRYFVAGPPVAKIETDTRCVRSTHGAGYAPMPTTPRMQMRIATASSGDTRTRAAFT